MIPRNIKRRHILRALHERKTARIPKGRLSRKFLLEYCGNHFPPKYVISLANKHANGVELGPEQFSGGSESNTFLRSLGFKVGKVSDLPKEHPQISARNKKTRQLKRFHNERCPKCKVKIRRMLEKIYGNVERNHKINIGTTPESFKGKPVYKDLKVIYEKLQAHRGHKDFVRVKTLPHCDFFVPNPGFILEFDESQHFTKPRELTLRMYPDSLKLAFDREVWIDRCTRLQKKDNDPPYRDEQRAWYDTLRDFSSSILDIAVVRVLPGERVWCDLKPGSESDVAWFKSFIENKLNYATESSIEGGKSLKIGLVFPELGVHDIECFLPLIKKHCKRLDLLVFPEGFETIRKDKAMAREEIGKLGGVKRLTDKYAKVSRQNSVAIVLGIQIDYHNISISGSGDDQYCLFMEPRGETKIYHKHSTSRYNAFFDDNWSINSNFIVRRIRNAKVGISICHDMYISLIPRVLKRKGAEIWINISYQNVRRHIWESVLQTRAIENGFIAACTLHRSSNASNPQKEPYAFSEKGKIELRDLETDTNIATIPESERAGKIYFLDTSHYQILPSGSIALSKLPEKARTVSVNLTSEKKLFVQGKKPGYHIKAISIGDFLFSPERLWKISLEGKDRRTIYVVQAEDRKEWEDNQNKVTLIVKGRIIEFSTLFLFTDKNCSEIFMAAYRSSNYKDSRIFYPKKFPVKFDTRFLKGMQSTFSISLSDPRGPNGTIYFERVSELIDFLRN